MDLEKTVKELKAILAELGEQRYGWVDGDMYYNYDGERALMRSVSPQHTACLMFFVEKFALHFIASRLSPGSVVVEIGSFLGGSAAIMAHANPGITIHGIDAFDEKQHTVVENQQVMIERVYGPGKTRTVENAQQWINQYYKNVTFYKTRSPDKCDTYSFADGQNIDLHLEDAAHEDPGLRRNIDFWFPRIKPGGILLMHDYRPWLPPSLSQPPWRFKDVENHVHNLVATKRAELLGAVRGLAIMRKF